ncbi:hypothetical protein BVRB_000500, partial [Beta vulgaris subsp. vulgaris]
MSTMIKTIIKALALVAITMAIAIALSSINVSFQQREFNTRVAKNIDEDEGSNNNTPLLLPSKRVSRFLVEDDDKYHHYQHGRSLKPADHCHKDYE